MRVLCPDHVAAGQIKTIMTPSPVPPDVPDPGKLTQAECQRGAESAERVFDAFVVGVGGRLDARPDAVLPDISAFLQSQSF